MVEANLELHLHGPYPPIGECTAEDVMLDGKRVFDWFLKEMHTTHADLRTETLLPINVTFKQPQILQIRDRMRQVIGITVHAKRVCIPKIRFVRIIGDGFYDWDSSKVAIPVGGKVLFTITENGFNDWENYDGDVDAQIDQMTNTTKQTIVMCFTVCEINSKVASQDVIDLKSL